MPVPLLSVSFLALPHKVEEVTLEVLILSLPAPPRKSMNLSYLNELLPEVVLLALV